MSSNTSIHALKSLLIPNGQDTRCFLRRVNETVGQGNSAKTSAFCPQVWDPERLPLEAHLCGDLQTRMLDDLAAILDHSYSDQAAKTEFINPWGCHFTPNDVFLLLREQCARRALQSNYEGGAKALSECL